MPREMLTRMGLVPGVSGEVRVAACENKKPEPVGASFQPQGPQSTRFPREAPERKGPSSTGLWSPDDHRGDAEVKPRAAGGAQSTRSVGGCACCSPVQGLAERERSARPAGELGRPGAAQWPGVPHLPSFLALAARAVESIQRLEGAAVPRANQFHLRSPGSVRPRAKPALSQMLTFFCVLFLKRCKHPALAQGPRGCLPENEGCEADLLVRSRSPRRLAPGYSEVYTMGGVPEPGPVETASGLGESEKGTQGGRKKDSLWHWCLGVGQVTWDQP